VPGDFDFTSKSLHQADRHRSGGFAGSTNDHPIDITSRNPPFVKSNVMVVDRRAMSHQRVPANAIDTGAKNRFRVVS